MVAARAPEADVVNVAAHLPAMAARQPDAAAIYAPAGRGADGKTAYAHWTYRELDERSDRIAHGLAALGIGEGTRIALMVRPSLELFGLVFGLFKAGTVPVMVDPGIGLTQIKACLGRARPQAFIGVPAAHAARLALGWARPTVKHAITAGRFAPWGGHTLAQVEALGADEGPALAETTADDLAAILFTSGSTGPPKGAVYTHGNFAAQVDAIRDMYGIQPGEVDLPTFPLFALFDPALGMTTVVPEMDPTRPAKASGAKLVDAIERFGVTNMFGSPALLNTLSRYGEAKGVKLPTMKRVISAGAPVPSVVLERMRSLLPDDAQVVTPYGATECLPVATIESREVLEETAAKTEAGAGVCVGRPVPIASVAILEITDEPIATISQGKRLGVGEIGEITVRGPQATRRYWEQEEATARAKILDGRGHWHRMGDVGYVDDEGRLWFCGRKSQRVQLDGETLFTAPVEGVLNAHPAVFRSALVGVTVDGRREAVGVVELEKDARIDTATLFTELRARARRFPASARVERFLVHPGLPVDIRHNAKIRRGRVAAWAQKRFHG